MDYNRIKSIIEQKFNPNDGYDIEIFFDYDDIISFTIYRDGEECLFLKFHEKFIRITSLHKCGINPGTTSGSTLLQKTHEIAKQIPGISYIELFDFSQIKLNWISIDLAFLKILTTGRSWYNSFGYVSVNYKTELEDNEKLRNENLIKILRESFGIQFIREVTKLYLYLNELFSEKNIIPIDQITIKKFFEYINRLGEIKFDNVQNVLHPEIKKRKLDTVQNVINPETQKRKLDTVQNVLHPETQKRKLDTVQNVINPETQKRKLDTVQNVINPETQKRKLDTVQNVINPETQKRKLDNLQNVINPETQKRKLDNLQNVINPETQKRKLDNLQNVLHPETQKRKLDNLQNVLHPETQKRKLDNLQNVLNKEQITTLKHLIDIIGLKINYNRNLIKTITCNNSYCIMMGGKTKKQNKKTKPKNKKTKQKQKNKTKKQNKKKQKTKSKNKTNNA
uniref:Uncharacterized protein n=1 Tax=viral metagenome TaxID=1070528 RepID=A0A6C0DIH4_9ZZZZ